MGDTEPREADTAPDTGHGRQMMEDRKTNDDTGHGREMMGDKYWETNDGRQIMGDI